MKLLCIDDGVEKPVPSETQSILNISLGIIILILCCPTRNLLDCGEELCTLIMLINYSTANMQITHGQ